jgi:hypothetical protein
VAQGVDLDPEFKLQYHKKTKNKKNQGRGFCVIQKARVSWVQVVYTYG